MATPSSPALKHHPCRYQAAHNLPAAKVSPLKMKGERAYRSSTPEGCHPPSPPSPAHLTIIPRNTTTRMVCGRTATASTHPQTRPAVERQILQPAKPALFPARGSALGATGLDNAKAIKLVPNESARRRLTAGCTSTVAGARACGDGRSAVGSSTGEIWVSRKRLGSTYA